MDLKWCSEGKGMNRKYTFWWIFILAIGKAKVANTTSGVFMSEYYPIPTI